MKHLKIWSDDERKLLFPASEITEVVELGDQNVFKIENVEYSDDVLNKLQTAFESYVEENEDFEPSSIVDFTDFVRTLYPTIDVTYIEEGQEVENVIAFEEYNNTFSNLSDFITTTMYQWWDGSNWKNEYLSENVVEYDLVVSDDSVSLDEWDGNNSTTGGRFDHQKVFKVIELDGKQVENTYLVELWSQYQGEHSQGEIMTESELISHLESLNRDIEEYLPLFKKKLDNVVSKRKQLHLPAALHKEIELLAVTDDYPRANDLYVELIKLGLASYKNKKASDK